MKRAPVVGVLLVLTLGIFPKAASADLLTFTGAGPYTGLSASAEFTLLDATTLKIVLTNTSTSSPTVLERTATANQLLTSLAFQLPGSMTIAGGSAAISAGSTGPAGNISKEWGWGKNGSGDCCAAVDPLTQFDDWISAKQPGTQQFAPGNLSHGNGLAGPDYGPAPTNAIAGGLPMIQNSATFALSLSGGVPDLTFLSRGAIVEFGSDAAFLTSAEGAGRPDLPRRR